jgi:hypothetical protein
VNESPSILARLRAGLADLLTRMAAGAHRLEDWSARGIRPILLIGAGLLVAAIVLVGVVHETRAVSHWFGGPGVARHAGPPPPAPKPSGKPDGRPERKPESGERSQSGAPVGPPASTH